MTAVELRQCDGAETAAEEEGQEGWAEEPAADVWRDRVASDAATFADELLGAHTPNIKKQNHKHRSLCPSGEPRS